MEIKAIMRYYLMPIRMASIKQTSKQASKQTNIQKTPENKKCWRGWGKLEPCALGWEYINKMVWRLWKTVWRFLKNLKTELSYDAVIPLRVFIQKS